MKYSELVHTGTRLAEIDRVRVEKGKLTQKLTRERNRLAKEVDGVRIPPATPRRAPTGRDYDRLGNTYAAHSAPTATAREAKRANRFGRFGERPLRSRIQRTRRVRRTGGVR